MTYIVARAASRLLAVILLAAFALALGLTSASACMYTPREGQEPVFEEWERGGMRWLYDEVQESALYPAADLGRGFVVQDAHAGTGCSGESSSIVQDCNTGEAIAFGGNGSIDDLAQWQLLDPLLQDIRAAIERGEPWSMAEIAAEATARGLEFAVPMRTTSRLRLGEMKVELGGACRAFYPRLPGSSG
jgi:hypothetical protein